MRLDDICLVNADVTASDDFYREGVGLERRMRNVRFADFVIGTGPRLAMWQRPSIAETVGPGYPTQPGRPFRVTLELPDATALDSAVARVPTAVRLSHARGTGSPAYAVTDPDGFTSVLTTSSTGRPRIAEIELGVSDVVRTYDFLERLGFAPLVSDGRLHFDGGNVTLTIVDAASLEGPGIRTTELASWNHNGGHVMLAIELDSGDAVDRLHADLTARGLADSGPPALYEWGARSAYFVDADGYIWEIYAWVEDPK
ncbi:VOC family protein [Herbiconiux ginsengi]|uniref:Catechol 2,3-dioxygenase n=1 Tax=Herbiconiux ginsengi TaxID=381665 RepID=A0A1H3JPC6_9MICO|nr:VOC family protein [Herbiconiux ginsengi]SDY41737.1 Catechol 2,3-dioxygenase [Herbiconiux ginsengi]